MKRRFISLLENLSLPPSVKITDDNLPSRLRVEELSDTYEEKNLFAVNVKDFGAKGDRLASELGTPTTLLNGGSDDTNAFNLALSFLNSDPNFQRDNANFSDSGLFARPTLFVPAGRYNVGDLDPVTFPYVRIVGAGRGATTIYHTGDDTLFTLGTPDPNQTDPFDGDAWECSFENLTMVQAAEWHGLGAGWGTEGERTRRGIVDNYSGNTHLTNVGIMGFQYGYLANGSADFSKFRDCLITKNDVGMYLGPRTQQFRLDSMTFQNNKEGLVLNGTVNGNIENSYFNDSTLYQITIEDTIVTREGIPVSGDDYATLEIANSWFEDNAGQSGRQAKSQICVRSDKPDSQIRNIWIHDCLVVGGGTAPAWKRAFLRVEKGRDIILERIKIQGILESWVHKTTTGFTGPKIRMQDLSTVEGYPTVPLMSRATAGDGTGWELSYWQEATYHEGPAYIQRGDFYLESELINHDKTRGVLQKMEAGNILSFGFRNAGSYIQRIALAIEQSKIFFHQSRDTSIGRVAAKVLRTAIDNGFRTGTFTTATRPSAADMGVGTQIFDTTLNKPLWSDGTAWRDSSGSIV